MTHSKYYDGDVSNPEWYVPNNKDPMLEILELYDSVLSDLLKLDCRLIVATGLTQIPYEPPIYYWRLENHHRFLDLLGIEFSNVYPRMTRDFLIEFDSEHDASVAQDRLSVMVDQDGCLFF